MSDQAKHDTEELPHHEPAAATAQQQVAQDEVAHQDAAHQAPTPEPTAVHEDTTPAAAASAPAPTAGTDLATPEATTTPDSPPPHPGEPPPDPAAANAAVLAESRRYTRRSFLVAGGAVAAAVGFYTWLDLEPENDMQPDLLRNTLRTNASIGRDLTTNHVLAPTYPLKRAETLRVNGIYGLKQELVPDSWRLQLVGVRDAASKPGYVPDVTAWNYRYKQASSKEDQGHDTKVDPAMDTARKMAPESRLDKADQDENHTGRKPRGLEEAGESDSTLHPRSGGLLLTLDDLERFPRHELVTQFKCIEGWSQIVHWAGIRLADFIEAYPPALVNGKEPRYVYMETPNGDYYTGYDLAICRHPQSLLVTEMMGAPLTQFHGAPLRLHMPTKYGYKQIKCIGLMQYTDDRPDDYWTKLGYDWYAGL